MAGMDQIGHYQEFEQLGQGEWSQFTMPMTLDSVAEKKIFGIYTDIAYKYALGRGI